MGWLSIAYARASLNTGRLVTRTEGPPVNLALDAAESSATWFVGASYGGVGDQFPRFLAEGIWENGYEDRHLDLVRSMRPGDRIAIKSSYTRKNGLPFDNRGHVVSVMAIKAIGRVTENLHDGRTVRVEWQKLVEPREWYLFTFQQMIWKLQPGENWRKDALIAFAFDEKPQDINRFCNAPYWHERFGTEARDERRFGWTNFYEAIATALLTHRNDRTALVEAVESISKRVGGLNHLSEDQLADGSSGFVQDICPFTTMGLFNRGITESNRKIIAGELAVFLGVEEEVPDSFEGIPVLNNLKSWYFPFEVSRSPRHIDSLWAVFAAAIALDETDDESARAQFVAAFDDAMARPLVAWNLTFGLYWARPWSFLSLDKGSRTYLSNKLRIPMVFGKNRIAASAYLDLRDALEPRFQEPAYPVHSYPELSLEAWRYKAPDSETVPPPEGGTVGVREPQESEADADDGSQAGAIVPYAIADILKEGCFLDRAGVELLLDRLRTKKNVILQGPPGTGKTWLAKRLAYALIGQKDDSKVRAVQFHPNLTYEDFVRGWRPTGDGKLSLADGVFMEAIRSALKNPKSDLVVVIEEINRGNPAQVFGELLTLLEAGKRTPAEALELCYADSDGSRRPVHIPENLYVIGTMNIADRSLALVDLALRRRFAFVNLEPKLGAAWRNWVVTACSVDPNFVDDIQDRISKLNIQIAADSRLGKQFRIGHSYVTPHYPLEAGHTKTWFKLVVETEIAPLLEEYWFDAPDEAEKARDSLLQGW